MLIHPWDAAIDAAEWRDWVATTDRFGTLAVGDLDPVDHRERLLGRMEQPGRGYDSGAATRQRRRLAALGGWRALRDQQRAHRDQQ